MAPEAANSEDRKRGADRFARNLLSRMTLAEKIGQLTHPNIYGADSTGGAGSAKVDIERRIRQGLVGSIGTSQDRAFLRRLQELAVTESPHGIPLLFTLDVIHGHRTIFPLPLALVCSWDAELVRQTARLAAREASADGVSLAWAPMLDISHDARWGRVAESFGEDPYLASAFARAMVDGLQDGDLSRPDTVMATAKHFAGYGFSEAGRDYHAVDVSAFRLHNTVLPPFRAALEAGAGAVMAAFSSLSGMPVTAHEELLQGLLRRRWNFDGLVVSDYTAIMELVHHGVATDLKEAALLAFRAGVDIELVSDAYLQNLGALVAEGAVGEAEVDAACGRVLKAKYRLGLFDDPFRGLQGAVEAGAAPTAESRQLARTAAARSCVLLQNDGVLPLPLKNASIAVVGPLADSRENMQGTWAVRADPSDSVSILEGMRRVAGKDARILYAKGANIVDDANQAARLNVFGMTFAIDERRPDELIAEAVGVATEASAVVACVGEAKEHSGEAATRSELGLPGSQRALVEALLATGKPVVLVSMSGRPLALEWESRHAAAILHAWFPGTEGGNAIAELLFGRRNPCGKLAMSFPRHVGQCPLTYAEAPSGRPADKIGVDAAGDAEVDASGRRVFRKFTTACRLEGPHTPLFPFGHGLGYSRFEYGPVRLDKTALRGEDDLLTASISVRNSGSLDGEEVVQLYVGDPVASRSRPVRELKGFQKLKLRAGEEGEARFTIGTEALRFWLGTGLLEPGPVWEPGEFVIELGPSSADLQAARVRWEK